MHAKIKKHAKVVLQTMLTTFFVALIVVVAAQAATTIGNNVSTGTITATGAYTGTTITTTGAITSGGAVAVTGNVTATARIGVASTTPYAVLSVEAADGRPAFTVGSTTNSVHNDMLSIASNGALTFNNVGAAESDFTIEGDSVTNLFVSDASVDRIGIASSTPWGLLAVEQATETYSFIVMNQGSSTPAFVVSGTSATSGGHRVGVGTSTPSALFSIGQNAPGTSTSTMLAIGFNDTTDGTTTIDVGRVCFRSRTDAGSTIYWWFAAGVTGLGGGINLATSTTSCF